MPNITYARHRFPPVIIQQAVWLYFRFPLSFRDAEDLVSGQRFTVNASLIESDTNRQNFSSQSEWEPDKIDAEDAPRAVRDYLDTLDDAAFGAATPVKPKFTSHCDPASQWTAARKGPAYFAYSTNYLIDTDNAVILNVEATRSVRQAEVGAARTMIDRVAKSFNLKPERLIADTAYGSAPMLDWLVQGRGIAPHIPVIHCPAVVCKTNHEKG
jgi:hypothetical protein